MSLPLRAKILLLTALPVVALVVATLLLVDRGVSRRTERVLRDDLVRAAQVFEDMIAARTAEWQTTSAVIVRDPRFFSVLTLPHTATDPVFRATVAGVAQDFHAIAHPDVFEVADLIGQSVASVGPVTLTPSSREGLIAEALAGRSVRRVLAQRGGHLLLVATPVVAGGRIVGALLIGQEVGAAMASRLRELTASDITFLADHAVTRSTLAEGEDREGAARLGREPLGEPRLIAGRDGRWYAMARALPYADGAVPHAYVLQRSFDRETAFLQDVRAHLAELGLVLLLLVVAASAWISTHITSPVRQLVAAAHAMEQGGWDAPIDRRRADELGQLAASFDDMRKRQREYVHHLEDVARAKSEFIAVASHELRTPITVIRGWAHLLMEPRLAADPVRGQQALEAILRSTDQLERVASDATRMSEAGRAADPAATRLAPTDLVPLLERAVREGGQGAPARRVETRIETGGGATRARVDGERIAQAVHALVQNGIRFTPDGGSIVVRTRSEGADLWIEVADTGIGLDDELRQRLGRPVFTPRDAAHHHTAHGLEFNVSGLGFGLALVRAVAEAHGGTLEIAGEPGRGSVFGMHLPGACALRREDLAA